MKKRSIILGASVVLLLAALWIVLATATSPTPVAWIRVVDATGKPVSGALISPDGLRPKKGGGHYWWGGDYAIQGMKPLPVHTGPDGYARVPYPFYVHEKLETGEISFAVDHPDYVADRPFRTVAASPPANAPLTDKLKYLGLRLIHRVQARPDPVVLQRGAMIRVRGYIGSKENLVTNLQADISNMWPAGTNFWRRDGQILWTSKATPGETFLRAIYCPGNGPVMFSEMETFDAKTGVTNELNLELEPGVRLDGRLDDTVPRPVRGGRVCIHVYAEGEDGNSAAPIWAGWRPLDDKGAFTFDSLPSGRLEITGLCDGHLSINGTSTVASGSMKIPQAFPLKAPAQNITLKMEPTAACEFTVFDPDGRPLAGARAGFWPNVLWGGNGSTIFGSDVYNTEDYYRDGPPADWAATRRLAQDDFHAVTGANGVALVLNLPAGRQDYSVSHTNFDMPINRTGGSSSRSGGISLTSGVTNRVTVRMETKGSEAITH